MIYSETTNVKPGTVQVRKYEIDKLIPYLANLKLKDITLKNYKDALNDLKRKGMRTIH
ncbi:hypothetical protein D5F11_002275 [Siminovitchia terrae]|uniref:Core-binding (CB) domain-containing protein n=1 Tax=Siminovitchia terrae TaxID=1914933 RepID=A0A429XEB7_SIMTE|nr:hypothetical protein D5F11_002275 [Siminovitchia terrae]